jgi:hypothetical protein
LARWLRQSWKRGAFRVPGEYIIPAHHTLLEGESVRLAKTGLSEQNLDFTSEAGIP